MTTRRRFLGILAGAATLPVIGTRASANVSQWRGIALGAEAHIILDHPDADRLIFLGDYLDRGENPKGVVDFILELSNLSRFVECLIGNHENIFLN